MACSKYTITNTGSTITTFNYQRCDNLVWEYNVTLNPNQTNNISLVNNTFSAESINNLNVKDITDVVVWPPTIDFYSQDISGYFPLTNTSCSYKCNDVEFDSLDTTDTTNSIQEVVDVFNANIDFNQYGTYFDNGDGRLGLSMPVSLLYTYCLTNNITLDIYS
jgi:hypothetical protein